MSGIRKRTTDVIEALGRDDPFTNHLTPTSARSINTVESFSATLTNHRLRWRVVHSADAV
ncbi:hypothetical protein [Lichenicoccus sp.]|uniref:hypothetical protein n=1 Tax=Lichenicoccus sp. TaxID=2781899 RepID=UPI003D1066E8